MAAIAKPAAGADRGPVGSERGAQTRKTIAYTLLIAYALLMFVPFAWSVATSFKTLPESVQVTFLPRQPTLDGYITAWTEMDPTLPRLFLNSFIIAGAITLLNLILDSLGGYAFARLRFPGREILFVLVLATLMIPDPLRVVPVYTLLVNVGLVGRGPEAYAGLIIISAVSATGLFLMRQYFMSIPRDLEEAARIDGAGHLQTYWRVILPLAHAPDRDPVRILPALLRGGHRGNGCQGLSRAGCRRRRGSAPCSVKLHPTSTTTRRD
ncbi:MAG: carbohydrate ABC transporter permease [Chloroflexi bacterium]|nr:carbohydrate ABC transporter permease [Chloroflexota bacterium]